jgi:midasin (ATPase involved in ribosome maturation)
MQLIGRSYDAKMVKYLDMVGKIHTPRAGNKQIDIPLVQMNALMGLLSDMLLDAIAESPLDRTTALRTQRAFNKLLWIQNDFITRHYNGC